MLRRTLLGLVLALLPLSTSWAVNCSSNPFTLTNTQVADATQVMSNFNNLLNCANNNLAHSGANSDITSLSGLSTPLSAGQGGSGVASPTANTVLLGNGASAFQTVAPSTSGNLLTSNGTTWSSTAPADAAATLLGTSTTTVVTPGGFAGNKSLAASGYYKFPGGLIHQWGSVTVPASTTGNVGFPISFSNNVFSFVVSATSIGDNSPWAGTAISLSTFQVSNANPSSAIGFNWFAVGN
jgi:hypothetical protein